MAIRRHVGAGRLWAACIHLIHQSLLFIHIIIRCCGPEAAMIVFRKALRHVAKSGEVWCEGARIYLNPTSHLFHLQNAAKCLNYALFFTPQYGDSIIEVKLQNSLYFRHYEY